VPRPHSGKLAGGGNPCQKGSTSGNYSPLGAAVQAMNSAMQGNFPPARPLLVMAGYAVVLGLLAIRSFRWE
jgi:hypothetical protein